MRGAGYLAVLSVAWIFAGPLWAQVAQQTSICGALPDGSAAPYLHLPVAKMRGDVVELRGLKSAEGEPTDAILKKTGAVLSAMFPRVPNLLAEEELSQTTISLPYTIDEMQRTSGARNGASRATPTQQMTSGTHTLDAVELNALLQELLTTAPQRSHFLYRVTSSPDPILGNVLEEYRTNADNEAVMLSTRAGSPHGIGFSKEWLLFLPVNLPQLRLRHLGHQKIDGHETQVVAFAQIPEKVTLPAEIQTDIGTCPYFTQGVVWIDRVASQIVRLQTDLISPFPGLNLQQLRTQTRFIEVKITGLAEPLWMPGETEIRWQTRAKVGGELHRYTGYRLFGSKVRILKEPSSN